MRKMVLSDSNPVRVPRGVFLSLLWLLMVVVSLAACDNSNHTTSTAAESVAQKTLEAPDNIAATVGDTVDCPSEGDISFICGLTNAEDLLQIGDSNWLLASGMASDRPGSILPSGKLHLINRQDRSWEVLFPGPLLPGQSPKFEHDANFYPDCPGPVDVDNFSVHGIALQNYPQGSAQYRLYITSHGAREAIETFVVDTANDKPTVTWTGCVPLPADAWANSVVILEDGGFLATKFMDPTGGGFEAIRNGELNGYVLEWHPGGEVTAIVGTELSGPNGIEISDDGRYVYVAAFGGNVLARYDLSTTPVTKSEVALGVVPDNVRWSGNGTLLSAGTNIDGSCFDADGNACGPGWSVWQINPDTMQAQRYTGTAANAAMPMVSTGLLVDDEVWIGTPFGDKVAILPKP